MPFVTEEIWSLMPGRARPAAVADWPAADAGAASTSEAEAELGRLIEAVTALRRYRDEVGAKPSAVLRGAPGGRGLRRDCASTLARLARLELVDGRRRRRRRARDRAGPRRRASQVLPSDAFDPAEAERRRRRAARASCAAEIERAERKLANERFVERAPAEVVEEERRKLEEYRDGAAPPGRPT